MLNSPALHTSSRPPRLGDAWLAMLALLCVLGGCATPAQTERTPITDAPSASNSAPLPAAPLTELQGQLSIKLEAFGDQAASGISLGFFFKGDDGQGQLDLMTLMGSQIAQVGWTSAQAWLINDQGRTAYDSLDKLSQDTLGEALPLRALIHWITGQPDPTLPSQSQGEPGRFSQQGWSIDATELPRKRLQATRPAAGNQRGVRIKVYLDL